MHRSRNVWTLMFLCFPLFIFAQTPVTLYGLKGPSGVGMLKLFDQGPEIGGLPLRVTALPSADLMVAKFVSGEAELGILPPNVAAKLYSAGRPLRIAAVVGQGMLRLLTSDPSIRTLGDLKGKTVEVAGQGATPDFVFRRILASQGFDLQKDIQLGYSLAYPETAQMLIAGRIPTALLPEPFATMALMGRPSLRVVGDIQDEWVKAGGKENYPMTVLVVTADFAQKHPQDLRTLLEAYRNSLDWVKAHPTEAGALAQKYDLGLPPPVVAQSIPKGAYVFLSAQQARPSLEALYQAFLDFSPPSIGGKLPNADFYLSDGK